MKTTLAFEDAGKGVELLGTAIENEPKKEMDPIFGVEVWSFENEYVITQKVRVTDAAIASVKGTLEFQVCREGQCVMFDDEFDIKVGKPAPAKENVAAAPVDKEAQKDDSLWGFFWAAFFSAPAAMLKYSSKLSTLLS